MLRWKGIGNMVEKRFAIEEDAEGNFIIVDNENGCNIISNSEIIDSLNILSDENEELLKKIDRIISERDYYENLCANEKRFGLSMDKGFVFDNLQEDFLDLEDDVNMLNNLYEENKHLKHLIRLNVFNMVPKGSLLDLQFKAIPYDNIIGLTLQEDMSVKLIIHYKGEIEKVYSFRNFIPFGVDYEFIKSED